MPKIEVNGVNIAYEIAGDGSPFVWSSHGWGSLGPEAYVVGGRMSANYKVLLWDRRNAGASGFGVEDSPSDWYLWTDDLHELLRSLGMGPAYLAGTSGGYLFSLLMAYRYPSDVKGLMLFGPSTDDVTLLKPIGKARYLFLAEVAEKDGMQAVFEASANPPEELEHALAVGWIAQCAQSEDSKKRILSFDAKEFAAIMRKWDSWFSSPSVYLGNIEEDEIRNIKIPAIVASGFDELHPEHTAKHLYNLLPNAEWADYTTQPEQFIKSKR